MKKKKSPVARDRSDLLVNRIAQCNSVLGHLNNCEAFGVILEDVKANVEFIDAHWQDVYDEIKIQAMREQKNACLHIVNLRQKYEEELSMLQKELKELNETDTIIPRDYDLETNMEK